jgi:hypothetical protein
VATSCRKRRRFEIEASAAGVRNKEVCVSNFQLAKRNESCARKKDVAFEVIYDLV